MPLATQAVTMLERSAWITRGTLSLSRRWKRQPKPMVGSTAQTLSCSTEPELLYEISHNLVQEERHPDLFGGRPVWVHRKGATRAFGPGFEGLPPEYRAIGQPVLVPGSMGTASWVLLGTEGSMAQTFVGYQFGFALLLGLTADWGRPAPAPARPRDPWRYHAPPQLDRDELPRETTQPMPGELTWRVP